MDSFRRPDCSLLQPNSITNAIAVNAWLLLKNVTARSRRAVVTLLELGSGADMHD
jgi:hypothetical protein